MTLYGTVDAGVWPSNSIGFKGTEDLGDGWSTVFELEKGYDLLTGKSSGDRAFKTTTLGLVNPKFGSLKIGRMGNSVQGYDRLKAGDWAQAVHSWIGAASYEIKGVTLAMAVGQDIHGRQSGLGSYFAPSPQFQYWSGGYIDKKFKTTGITLNATVPVSHNGSAIVGWSTSLYALWPHVSGFSYQKVRGQQLIVGLDHSF